jgi:hypothetical protein
MDNINGCKTTKCIVVAFGEIAQSRDTTTVLHPHPQSNIFKVIEWDM